MPIERMGGSVKAIDQFVDTLVRLSRRAQLLSVNAAIEAAHLGDGGARFTIVATEVRKLAASTRTSAADVEVIAKDLDATNVLVSEATQTSMQTTETTSANVTHTADTISESRRSIEAIEDTIGTIADIAAEQGTSLQSVVTAVDEIARHADEAAHASRDAASLDLDRLLDTARDGIRRWTLLDRVPATARGTLADWIDSLCNGDDTVPDEIADGVPDLVDAVRSLIARADDDGRTILAGLSHIALAVASNVISWKSIAGSFTGVRSELDAVRNAIEESVLGARTAVDVSANMQRAAIEMQRRYDDAVGSLEDALDRVGAIGGAVAEIDRLVETMSEASRRAEEIVSLVAELSSETDILALNAAIESSHAGENGRGFSVIASEIRRLALLTHDSTTSVGRVVGDVAASSSEMRESIGTIATIASGVTSGAGAMRDAITALRSSFDGTIARAHDVSDIARAQAVSLDRVLANVAQSVTVVEADAAIASDERRFSLLAIGAEAHHVAARRSVGRDTAVLRRRANAIAEGIEGIFDTAIAGGRITARALTDFTYTEIRGDAIPNLRRLFDVSRVPATGFTPAKFAAPWDATIDESVIEVLERSLDSLAFARVIAMVVCDLNAFMFAVPRRAIAGWTGDSARDFAGNRIKRFVDEPYSLHNTRIGLGAAGERVPARASYATFIESGCTLERPAGERPWAIHAFARDTNDVFNEMLIPIYVRGMRHSTLRVAYASDVL